MAYFDYTLLTEDMEKKTGYKLYSDFGEISPADIPRRRVNEIVTPVVGVFRLNPVPLTALATPYIAVVSGTIEIPAPSEVAEDIRKHLNEVAADFNAKAERQTQGDTTFAVVYSFETCVVDDKRRDVGLYNGEIVVITQAVTFTIVERGITALDTELKINGLSVPFLRLDESRVSTSETTPNTEGHGEVSVTQEMYGITFDTPLMDNILGEMLLDIVNNGAGNKAFAVEVIRNGKSSAYLMAVGTATTSANPPANIGVSVSLADIAPTVARYNDIFKKTSKNGIVVFLSMRDSLVFWGDGSAEHIDGYTPHVYTDGKATHDIYYIPYGNANRYGEIVRDASIFKKTLRPKRLITTGELPPTILATSTGDKIAVSGNRVNMVVNGTYIPIDEYDPNLNVSFGIIHPFTCLLRGKVTEINTDLLEYDRWAVGEED